MVFSATVFASLGLAMSAAPAMAHAVMSNPPPFLSKHNPNTPEADIPFNEWAPLGYDSDSVFPCKGQHKDFSTAQATASYAAGGNYSVSIDVKNTHNGGSCQISLSFDEGKTFEVVKSVEGACPPGQGQDNQEDTIDFVMPSDVPEGKAILAWTWIPMMPALDEMYMSCAPVEITNSAGVQERVKRPEVFVANLPDIDCRTERKEVSFPDPGEFVEIRRTENLAAPKGTQCGPSAGTQPSVLNDNTQPPAETAKTSAEVTLPTEKVQSIVQPSASVIVETAPLEVTSPVDVAPLSQVAPPVVATTVPVKSDCDPTSGAWCADLWGRKRSPRVAQE